MQHPAPGNAVVTWGLTPLSTAKPLTPPKPFGELDVPVGGTPGF